MRQFTMLFLTVLTATSVDAASYLQQGGAVINPIQNVHGGDHLYSGPDLEQYVNSEGGNLTDAYLHDADLTGANLKGVDLGGADLSSANLTGTDLTGATLVGANLSVADLRDSVLLGTDLSHADLSRAHLSWTDLESTNLTGADLRRANLSYTSSLGAVIGLPYYDKFTNFSNSWIECPECGGPAFVFDPVAAGWTLIPEPTTLLLTLLALVAAPLRVRCG